MADILSILQNMTLEEKAALCTGACPLSRKVMSIYSPVTDTTAGERTNQVSSRYLAGNSL